MKYNNTNITAGDVAQWIADFTKTYEVIDVIEELSFEDKAFLRVVCATLYFLLHM